MLLPRTKRDPGAELLRVQRTAGPRGWTNEQETGGRTVTRQVNISKMPIYVRAGAIIPYDPIRQYTDQPVDEPTTIRVYRGSDGQFTLYEDDGISLDYLKGRATWTSMTWDDAAQVLTIEPGAPKGQTSLASNRIFKVQLLPEGTTKNVNYSGIRTQIEFPHSLAEND